MDSGAPVRGREMAGESSGVGWLLWAESGLPGRLDATC